MQNKKRTPLDAQQSHLWIIGGGIAGMAAAAFAIRDAKVPAKNIHILNSILQVAQWTADIHRMPRKLG